MVRGRHPTPIRPPFVKWQHVSGAAGLIGCRERVSLPAHHASPSRTAGAIQKSGGVSGTGEAPERRPRFAGRFVGLCRRAMRSPGAVTLARDLKEPECQRSLRLTARARRWDDGEDLQIIDSVRPIPREWARTYDGTAGTRVE